jgi:hypothetical protein
MSRWLIIRRLLKMAIDIIRVVQAVGHLLWALDELSSSFGSVPDWTGTDWSSLNAGGHGAARCVEIPSNMSLCRNMEYTQMRLPNLLEHDTLREVSQQASSWVRLLQVSCHSDTQVQYM